MKEKRSLKINFLICLLILAIVVIIIMAYFIYKLNNEKIANLNDEINKLQNRVNDLNNVSDIINDSNNKINNLPNEENDLNDDFNIVNNSNNEDVSATNSIINNTYNDTTYNDTTSTKYKELSEENYKKYNTSPYSFRIQEMIDNKNGTITIMGRVYKETELLKISREQYGDLLNEKTIDLLGYQMKVNKEEDPNNGGYDMLITSTGDKWMKFYVEKNSDGSGKLHYYTEEEMYIGTPFKADEAGRYIGTDTYLQITLDENLKCEFGNTSTTLRKEFNKSNGRFNVNMNDDIKLPYLNDEFHFENGKCVSIIFSNV